MDETRTVTQRLAAEHDPVEDLRRREAYLADKRRRMPHLVRHQELMRGGMTHDEILQLDFGSGGPRARRNGS
jgi:hypothetical protein